MSKKEKKPQEAKKVPVVPVSSDQLEWMRLTAELNAGSGKASFWDRDIYSCLCELKELRAARITVYMDIESHPPMANVPLSNSHFGYSNSELVLTGSGSGNGVGRSAFDPFSNDNYKG
jgi:hypothetical protein